MIGLVGRARIRPAPDPDAENSNYRRRTSVLLRPTLGAFADVAGGRGAVNCVPTPSRR